MKASRDDFLRAGMVLLRDEGEAALTIDALCRAVGRTKGSFYHHFADIDAYQASLLVHWEAENTRAPIAVADSEPSPARRRQRLYDAVASVELHVERAMQAWALHDARAREARRRVDALRLGYLAQIWQADGIEEGEARDRARLEYACFLGTLQLFDLETLAGKRGARAVSRDLLHRLGAALTGAALLVLSSTTAGCVGRHRSIEEAHAEEARAMREEAEWFQREGLTPSPSDEIWVSITDETARRCVTRSSGTGADAGGGTDAPATLQIAGASSPADGGGSVRSREEVEAPLDEACAFQTGKTSLDVRSTSGARRSARLLRLGDERSLARDREGSLVIVAIEVHEAGVRRVHRDGTCNRMPAVPPDPFQRPLQIRATWSVPGAEPRRIVRRVDVTRTVVECDHYVE